MGKDKKAPAQVYDRHPFLLSVDEVASKLQTNLEVGLTDVKVQELQRIYGPNRLKDDGGVQWYTILMKQATNAMIMVC